MQDELAEKDDVVVEFNKRIRVLLYQMRLYEEQIVSFNTKIRIVAKTDVYPQ